ncbi:uncharacterized protein LOC117339220 [Pecten maximus]|uniref:uncharacterized protein LOC117339220 n=1 Tax=Pecten maximus TaxID=6579 RepID=UPI001458022C|nr:uncharacterized protein LOC117339220 [Pecten maximus]
MEMSEDDDLDQDSNPQIDNDTEEMFGSITTAVGVNMISGNDQGRQSTHLGITLVSKSALNSCLDRLRPVLSGHLDFLPSSFTFCTKQGWSISQTLENSIMVRSIVSDDGIVCIQPSHDKPKVGIKSKYGEALGFVFVEYTCILASVRDVIQKQLFPQGKSLGDEDGFVFLDPNGWPVSTDQESTLSVFDVLLGNCLRVSITMTTSVDLMRSGLTTPEGEPPCKRLKLQGSSPLSFRSVKDSSRCLESPQAGELRSKQILISYVRAEAAGHAVELKNQLSALGCSVYLDVDEIKSGVDWQDSLNYAVSNCEIFLPLVTPIYGETQWTNREVKLADVLGKFILPVNFLEEWPPRCLAIQFATTQYISWKTPTQIQTELAEGLGEAVLDYRVWDKKYISLVASKVADRVNQGWNSSRVPSLVKRKTIVKSCAMVSCSNSQAVTSNRDGLPLIVICLHPQQQEQGSDLKDWLQEEGFEVWLSTQLDITYPDSLPSSPTVRLSQSSQTSLCEEEQNNNSVFQEKADDAGVILAVLSEQFGASRTCQQQVYYCEHRKRLIAMTTLDKPKEFPLWVNMLMGKESWLNIKNETFRVDILRRIRICLDRDWNQDQTSKNLDMEMLRRGHTLRGNIQNKFSVCVMLGDVSDPGSCQVYRSVLSQLSSLEDVTLVTCSNPGVFNGYRSRIGDLHQQYNILTVSPDTQEKHKCVNKEKLPTVYCGKTEQERDATVAGVCDLCILVYGNMSMEQLVREFLWNDRTVIPILSPLLSHTLTRIRQVPQGLNLRDWSVLSDQSVTADRIGPVVKTITDTLLTRNSSPHRVTTAKKSSPFKAPQGKGTLPESLKSNFPTRS